MIKRWKKTTYRALATRAKKLIVTKKIKELLDIGNGNIGKRVKIEKYISWNIKIIENTKNGKALQ